MSKTVLTKLELGLRILMKFMLLSPILMGMILFNYTVDRSGFFHTEEKETLIARAMLDGKDIIGYDQINERKVYEEMTRIMEQPFDTLSIGSSRVLQLRREIVGGSFMNCGMSNADYRDIMAVFYMFDRAEMLPKNLIICVDPGLFYDSEVMLNQMADENTAKLFDEFISLRLGLDSDFVPAAPDGNAKFKSLISPSYFQGNVKYVLSGKKRELPEGPEIVTGNLMDHLVNIKLSDGSVLYSRDYREMSADQLEKTIINDVHSLKRLNGYTELSPRLTELFDLFVKYVQSRGINVVFMFPPYHARAYWFAEQFREDMPGFFEAEEWCRSYAVKNNIAMYGSYNPLVDPGYYSEDFFDGLHPTPDALKRLFPGIDAAVGAIKSGSPTSPEPFGGNTVSVKTAEYYLHMWETIAPPDIIKQVEDDVVNGQKSYIFARFDGTGEDAIQTAKYAVTINQGIIYRFDTDAEEWVNDPRF